MIVKECVPPPKEGRLTAFVVRYGNHYARTLAFIQALYEEARKDFPDLTPDQVEVVQFSESPIKGMFGITFALDVTPPESYTRRSRLEYIY